MCVYAAKGTAHTEVKLWTKLKPAYPRNAEGKKYFSAVYVTGMFPHCKQANTFIMAAQQRRGGKSCFLQVPQSTRNV